MKKEVDVKIGASKVKVIVHEAKKVQNRIVKYGFVASLGDVEKFYKVAKRRYGSNRFGYKCDCDDNFWRGRICKHIAAFKLGEGA